MNFEPIAEGAYLEGICVDGDALWFSDAAQGGLRRVAADGRIDEWCAGKRWIGGILMNQDGKVLFSGAGGISWLDPATGAAGMLVDTIHGAPIRGVNEMAPDGQGGLYFGVLDIPAIEARTQMETGGLYRLDTAGRVTALWKDLAFPNGLAASPDGRRLYANETYVGTFAYDVAPDGSLGPSRCLLDKPDADGMALDAHGDLWVTGFRSAEILCVGPDGTLRRRVPTPSGAVSNLRFGGVDGRDLYITAATTQAVEDLMNGLPPANGGSTVYRARSDVAGLAIGRTAFRLD